MNDSYSAFYNYTENWWTKKLVGDIRDRPQKYTSGSVRVGETGQATSEHATTHSFGGSEDLHTSSTSRRLWNPANMWYPHGQEVPHLQNSSFFLEPCVTLGSGRDKCGLERQGTKDPWRSSSKEQGCWGLLQRLLATIGCARSFKGLDKEHTLKSRARTLRNPRSRENWVDSS